jgi:hypothetical protein
VAWPNECCQHSLAYLVVKERAPARGSVTANMTQLCTEVQLYFWPPTIYLPALPRCEVAPQILASCGCAAPVREPVVPNGQEYWDVVRGAADLLSRWRPTHSNLERVAIARDTIF